jgi:hypothetical protein
MSAKRGLDRLLHPHADNLPFTIAFEASPARTFGRAVISATNVRSGVIYPVISVTTLRVEVT